MTDIDSSLTTPATDSYRVPLGCVLCWSIGILLVPSLFAFNEGYSLYLPIWLFGVALAATVALCSIAIAFIRISLLSRIGLLLLSVLLWWCISIITFVAYFDPSVNDPIT